jgi:acetolactate synthase-1/2/3 large subunit
MKYTGARILVESLIENGVDVIFGYPGGSVLNIYDELYNCKDRIRHILVSHEQHAAHAADGYARSTGKVGVCLATSGPGATNLVTGIATAFVDSVPLVIITGNVSIPLLGKDSFQEVDITGITMPVVKHNWIVENVSDLAQIVYDAFVIALSGRPGPVLIDIPKDINSAVCEHNDHNVTKNMALSLWNDNLAKKNRAWRLFEKTKRKNDFEADIKKASVFINESSRPMIFAGGGVNISGAGAELKILAELLNAPVALSLMGMGAIARDHPLCTGLIGMHGTIASNKAVQKADLLIALGTRFSDRVTSSAEKFAKDAKIIHIDIDPAEINKNIFCDAFITGDLKTILGSLIKKIIPKPASRWNDEIKEWKTLTPKEHNRKKALSPRFVIQEAAKVLGEDAIVVTDVGQHQIWTAQFYPFKKQRSFLSSAGLGTMGFGMGAAAGAKIANPESAVVLFTGDGCFRMNSAEMATLVKYGLPVLIIVFNNSTLGMLRQWQKFFYKSHYYETGLDNSCPDFVKLADAYGVPAFRVTNEKGFTDALENGVKLLTCKKPVLIEVIIDKDEKVVPMTPSGKPVDKQIM